VFAEGAGESHLSGEIKFSGRSERMKKAIMFAAVAALAAASALSASAAMSSTSMHHTAMHQTMHVPACKGEFMYMDPKSHKCADSRTK
jgi:ABC-type oligopeptide transport system substrate-binding subunit